VSFPLFHSPDYDLIAELDGRLLRVQAKTCTVEVPINRYEVSLATRGGNQSWNGLVKHFDPSRCDRLFVLVADGRRWFIPSKAVAGKTCIAVGGPKYAAYEVAGREAQVT
jgi:hypothetical protein